MPCIHVHVHLVTFGLSQCTVFVCSCTKVLRLYVLHVLSNNFTSLFQAVNKKLYDDQAALYYLLLHKWEKGQLQLPLTVNPALNIRGHRSTSSLPPSSVPQINIQGVESLSGSSGFVVPPWQTLNAPLSRQKSSEGTSDTNMDDNLQRYLNLGRRHTLGTAHNFMLIPQEDMNRLRKINESVSSQASSGFGSSGTNAQIHPEIPISLVPTLSTGIEDKAQMSIGSVNSANRQLLHTPMTHRSSKRRASDGGHYAAAYRNFIEMRKNPMNAQVGQESSGSNSIRQLLYEKIESDKKYGRQVAAQKQWILYKDQLNVNQYSSTGLGPNMTIPSALPPIVQLSTAAEPTVDLRQQLQPFLEYSPQQIQEQLQHLHLKPQEPLNDYVSNDTNPCEMSIVNSSALSSNNSSNSSSSVNTTQSRKSSTSSSLIAQLLSPPTPPLSSVNLPSHATKTPSASTAEYINNLDTPVTSPRRYSIQPAAAVPSYSQQVRQKRNTLPVLSPTRIPNPQEELPLFASTCNPSTFDASQDVLCASPERNFLLNDRCQSPTERTSPSLLYAQSSSSHGGPPSPGAQEHQGGQGVILSSLPPEVQPFPSQLDGPVTNGFIREGQPHGQEHLQNVQQIPIFLNQHISLIHPKVANQIAQQQVGRLVSLISSVLSKYGIMYEYNGNIFTVSHEGVEFQIHVQVSSHYTLQNALQLNLQYMHISGDPQLYQSLCTQLAPHFIPTLQ